MILFANAKINLGLHILGKRDDGYHNLESVLYPIPFFDVIEFYPSGKFSLHLHGKNLPGPLEDNLVSKAFQLVKEQFSIPEIELHLLKNIPAGTGLGGGSSDAARLLSGLNQMFHLGLNNEQLSQMAGSLGSDCPFFINNVPSVTSRKGEILEEIHIDLAGYFLVLAIPGISVETAKAYSLLNEPFNPSYSLHEIVNQPIEAWNNLLTNDFERVIFPEFPELKEIKNNLMENGAQHASLTGSGSTVYGIYKKRPLFVKQRPDVQYLIFQL